MIFRYTLKGLNFFPFQCIQKSQLHFKKRIFSGIQPTGAPHLGNYFGAIRKWVDLQNKGNDCIFSIVDLHSMTVPQDSKHLRQNIHLMAACLLASGIDPEKSVCFLQSQVPQHTELAWILGCMTTMTRLTHQPQFKNLIEINVVAVVVSMLCKASDRSKFVKDSLRNFHRFIRKDQNKWVFQANLEKPGLDFRAAEDMLRRQEKSSTLEHIPLGLYVYPVLQSADILLYKATEVPVGEDQLQHIQLSQHLVKVFNNKYGKIFPVPEASIDSNCARIKSLRQPEKKMSKSDKDFKNRIDLTDPPDLITKRIKEALTDFTSAVFYDPEKRPGVSNLILIHSLCTGKSFDDICQESSHLDTGKYKLVVAECVINYLKPFQEEIRHLLDDRHYLTQALELGAEKARSIAHQTMMEVKEAVGLSIFDECKKSIKLKA